MAAIEVEVIRLGCGGLESTGGVLNGGDLPASLLSASRRRFEEREEGAVDSDCVNGYVLE